MHESESCVTERELAGVGLRVRFQANLMALPFFIQALSAGSLGANNKGPQTRHASTAARGLAASRAPPVGAAAAQSRSGRRSARASRPQGNGSIEALSDRPALKFPSSETPDVQMISVQTRPDAVARELDLDFGLVCRHQFCADRARHTSSGSGEECAIGCSARQFSVKHRCTRLFAKHCFSEHLGASRFWLTAEGKTPKG
jgi:hypothetical protein